MFREASKKTVRRRMLRATLALGTVFLCAFPCHAQQTQNIRIPYSLTWGDGVDKVREMLTAVKGRETACSQKAPGQLVLEADGLGVGDQLLKKSLFTVRDGSLVEVELQYADPSWTGERALDFFDRTRSNIDKRYGAGKLLVKKEKERPPVEKVPGGTTYTLLMYRWNQPAVALELSYYAAEEGEGEKAKALRLVSLEYKTP